MKPCRLLLVCVVLLLACSCANRPNAPNYNVADDVVLSGPQKEIRALKVLRRAQTAAIGGELESATTFYGEALTLYEELRDFSAQAAIHNDLGLMAKSSKQPKKALELLTQALALASRGDVPTVEAEARFNLAGVHYELGDLAASESVFSDTIAQAEKLSNKELLGLAYSGRGNVRRRRNAMAPALDDYTKALSIWNGLKRSTLAAVTLMNIGYSHVLKGESDEAAQAFQASINQLSSGKPSPDREILVPHLEEMIRRVKRDPAEAREKVLKTLGR